MSYLSLRKPTPEASPPSSDCRHFLASFGLERSPRITRVPSLDGVEHHLPFFALGYGLPLCSASDYPGNLLLFSASRDEGGICFGLLGLRRPKEFMELYRFWLG